MTLGYREVLVRLSALLLAGLLVTGQAAGQSDDPFGGSDSGGESGGDDPFGGPQPADGDPFGPDTTPPRRPATDSPAKPARVAASQNTQVEQTVIWAEATSPASERIENALAAPLTSVGLDFQDAPLEEIVEFLRDEYDIEIQLDTPALDELGISPDEMVSCNLRNISLRSALRLTLRQLELTTLIADEVLLITTEEEAEAGLTVAVYPVGDLLNHQTGLGDVIDMLVSTVAASSWADNGGGDAEVRALAPGVLVISQTQAVHGQILKVLTAIRRANQLPQAVAPADAKQPPSEPRRGRGSGFGGGGGGQFAVPTRAGK